MIPIVKRAVVRKHTADMNKVMRVIVGTTRLKDVSLGLQHLTPDEIKSLIATILSVSNSFHHSIGLLPI